VKTVNQLLKHKVNRCVLSLCLNKYKLSASRTAAGRLFHTTGPATEKALSPSLVLVRGTVFSVPCYNWCLCGCHSNSNELRSRLLSLARRDRLPWKPVCRWLRRLSITPFIVHLSCLLISVFIVASYLLIISLTTNCLAKRKSCLRRFLDDCHAILRDISCHDNHMFYSASATVSEVIHSFLTCITRSV